MILTRDRIKRIILLCGIAVLAAAVSQTGMYAVYRMGGTVRQVTIKSCALILLVSFFCIAVTASFHILFGKRGRLSFCLSAFCALVVVHSLLFPINDVYYRYSGLAAIMCVEFLLVPFAVKPQNAGRFKLSKGFAPENCFAVIALVFGLFMCFFTPVSSYNCWDDETHYSRVVQLSQSIYPTYTEADIKLQYSPDPEYSVSARKSSIEEYDELEKNPPKVYVISDSRALFTDRIGYIGSVVFRWVGQLFGMSFSMKYMMGRIGNLLLYATLMYLAIQHLNKGKMLLCVLGLAPTPIYLASNYSADPFVIGMFSVGFSYFIRSFEDGEKLNFRDLFIMLGAFVLACLPKMPYLILLGFLFLIPRESFESSKARKYFNISAAIAMAGIFMLMFVSSFMTGEVVADTRGGDNINALEQIKYIISNIPQFLKILSDFMLSYLSPLSCCNYLSQLGGAYSSKIGYLIFVMMIFAAVVSCPKINLSVRVIGIIIAVCQAVALASVMYMVFTPVGSASINGCQERYLLPIVFPAMVFAFGGWKKIKINQAILCPVSAVILAVTYYSGIVAPTFA